MPQAYIDAITGDEQPIDNVWEEWHDVIFLYKAEKTKVKKTDRRDG